MGGTYYSFFHPHFQRLYLLDIVIRQFRANFAFTECWLSRMVEAILPNNLSTA